MNYEGFEMPESDCSLEMIRYAISCLLTLPAFFLKIFHSIAF